MGKKNKQGWQWKHNRERLIKENFYFAQKHIECETKRKVEIKGDGDINYKKLLEFREQSKYQRA